LDKEVELLDEDNVSNFEESDEEVSSPINKCKRSINQNIHHQVK